MTRKVSDTFSTLYPPKPIVLSQDPDAKYSPFGENTTLQIGSEWPIRVLMFSPLDTFHTLIVMSKDPDAKYSPLEENTTPFTESE